MKKNEQLTHYTTAHYSGSNSIWISKPEVNSLGALVMPPGEQTHSTLIREAARTILRPLGLTQQGRSRTWLDDRGWWLCIVEFQPGWGKGSYLNVGCMWIWRETDYLSFDVGHRVEGFTSYENLDQFRSVANMLALRAANEVERYRSLFQTVLKVSDYYIKDMPSSLWPSFNAGIACAAAGRVKMARRFFAQVLDSTDERDWVRSAQIAATQLNSMVHDTDLFRHRIQDTVAHTRKLLKLPEESERIAFG